MLPLQGIRIIEAAQMISAPFATSILSDQGAEVIKIEAANGVGDRMRFLGDRRGGIASVFHAVNRGKKSVTLNTKDPEGVDALLRLIDSADVFVQNFRPGAIERMGVSAEVALKRNPRLIYVSVSGFGPTGPYVDQMVYDFVIQGYVGLTAREGMGGKPRLSKTYVVDKATALTVAQAISSALFYRERTGEGQHLQVDMLAAGLQFHWPDGMCDHTLLGDDFVAVTHMAAAYDVRPTKDGYVTLNLASKTTWPKLVKLFDSPLISDDPRFADFDDRQANANALMETVDAILAQWTSDEVVQRMRDNDLPGGKSLAFDEVHLDAQTIHNRALVEHDNGPIGRIREPRPAARFGAKETPDPGPAPLLGADTDAVLADIGYSPEDLARLADAGVTRDIS